MAKKKLWMIAGVIVIILAIAAALLFLIPGETEPENATPTSDESGSRQQIIAHAVVGAWARDRAGDSKIGPQKSYDEFVSSYWNPQAPGNYQGEPGIVYLLDGYYDLTDFTAYFANREYFFKLYTSTDCNDFTQIFEVNKDNMETVYDSEYCCSITGLEAKNVAFLKIVFTGSNSGDNNTYISLRHVKFGGTWLKEGPAEIPIEEKEEVKKKSIIADYLITGAWVRDRDGDSSIGPKMTFDGNDYTYWNPQANGKYQGNPGIVYMLDGYYDLESLRIITEKREYYMQVYTSANGEEYTLLADITPENYTEFYDGFTCTLENLSCKDVGYIKLVFTGSNSVDNNTYLSLAEVEPAGTKLDKPAPTEIPDTEPKVSNTIIAAHRVSGSWVRDREDMESLSPAKSYDKNAYTHWNPQANGGYAGKPGIVYMLNGYYDVDEIQLIFGNREYFFEVYTSADGYKYSRVAKVTAGNMKNHYKDLTCTLSDLGAKNVGYVKVVFTGSNSSDNNTYVSLLEAVVTGTKLDKEAPTTIPDTDEKIPTTKIANYMIVGSWVRDREDTDSLAPYRAYDENLYSGWNPQANSGYAGKPGVIYRLKSYYNISKIQLNFDKREYFFELYTSVDGLNFDLAAKITKDNMEQFYKGYTFILDNMDAKGVGYIKLIFTGSNSHDNNTYISLMEVGVSGTKLNSTPGKIPQQPEEEQANPTIIANHKVTGQWIRDREDTPSLAPNKTYDANLYTGWNPQTQSGYEGDPGIIYMLNGYYDVTGMELTFDKREYFFRAYTSADGENYTLLADVTVNNFSDYYEDLTCNLNNLFAANVGYIKLVFTGSNSGDNNTFITMMEVQICGTRLDKDAPTEIPDVSEPEATEPEATEPDVTEPEITEPEETEPESAQAAIIANEVIGSWVKDRVGDSTYGPEKSYDGSDTTKWNPSVAGFNSEASIIYTLDGNYDLSKLVLTFGNRQHYITISISTDGESFTELAAINSGNAEQYYTDYICTLSDLTATNVQYVKVTFIGTQNGTTWLNVMEVNVFGTVSTAEPEETEPEDTEPEVTEPEVTEPEVTEPEVTEPEVTEPQPVQVAVIANEVIGSWANDRVGNSSMGPEMSYDGNDTTKWNPAVTGFNSEASIIYTLDKNYDLSKVAMIFGNRQHYITISVSTDGESFTELATINSGNAEQYYTDYICTLNDLIATNVQYVKVTFIGTQNGTTWLNVMEVNVYGTVSTTDSEETEPEVTEPEVTEPQPVQVAVIANEVIGSWANDRVGNSSMGPEKSYDGDATTKWNPAVTGFNSNASIIYTLDKKYDLSRLVMIFGSRKHYITVSVSADGENYTEVATINSTNAAEYYTDNTCTLNDLTVENVKYIQVSFIGTENNTTWLNVMEVRAEGTVSAQ